LRERAGEEKWAREESQDAKVMGMSEEQDAARDGKSWLRGLARLSIATVVVRSPSSCFLSPWDFLVTVKVERLGEKNEDK
jgi:hypothetical protein